MQRPLLGGALVLALLAASAPDGRAQPVPTPSDRAASSAADLARSTPGTPLAPLRGAQVILFEDFHPALFPPEGWSTYDLDGDGHGWASEFGTYASPPGSARHAFAQGEQDGWLVSPAFEVPDDGATLMFMDGGQWMTAYGYSGVHASSGSCDPADGDFEELAEITDTPGTTGPPAWRTDPVVIGLADYAGLEICIAFVYRGDLAHTWFVDDVMVVEGLLSPPRIEVAPLAFEVSAEPGEPATRTLTIANTGDLPLDYALRVLFDLGRAPRPAPLPEALAYTKHGRAVTIEAAALERPAPAALRSFDEDGRVSFEASEGFVLGPIDGQQGWSTYASTPTQPSVSDAASSHGAWSLLLGEEPGLDSGVDVAAFSPEFLYSEDLIRVALDVRIDDVLGSDYDLLAQAPSQGGLAFRVKFNWLGGISIVDEVDGEIVLETVASYEPGRWGHLEVVMSRPSEAIFYYYNGELIHEGSFLTADIIEELVFLHDNFTQGDGGYFDNVRIEGTPSWLTLSPLAGTVEPGQSEAVTLSFNTDDFIPGVYHAELIVASNDPEHPALTVPVAFTVEGRALVFDPPLETGLEAVAEAGSTLTETVTLSNPTDASIAFAFTDFEASAAPTFVTGVSPSSGIVPAGGSASVAVALSAEGRLAGTYSGRLALESDEPALYAYPVTLVVTGEGVLVLDPEPVDFGEVIVGFSETLGVTLTNEGAAATTITGIETESLSYHVAGFSGPVELAPGESTAFEVTFAPELPGPAEAALSIAASSGGRTAGLLGTGLFPPQAGVPGEEIVIDLLEEGPPATAAFALSNEADPGAASLDFAASVVAARPRSSRLVEPPEVVLGGGEGPALAPAGGAARARAYTEVEGPPFAFLRGGGEVMLTHSLSQEIEPYASIACASPFGFTTENSFWRVFKLADFEEVGGGLTVSAVEVGVEVLQGSSLGTSVRLYTLEGAFETSNLTLVAEASGTIPAGTSLETLTFPIEGEFAPTDVLVVEWHVENGDAGLSELYPGANSEGETAPGYISSASCDMPEPTPFAELGYPWVHLVMNVYGTARPALLAVSPRSGSVAPGQNQEMTLTANPSETGPGEYAFEVVIASNDPVRPTVTVPVTVNVGGVATEEGARPLAFALSPAYPNPFSASTTIEFALPEASSVRLRVFDAVGRLVATLVEGEREAGFHEVAWPARGLAGGVYFVRLEAGPYRSTQKMMLLP